jgi:hypothetical protein
MFTENVGLQISHDLFLKAGTKLSRQNQDIIGKEKSNDRIVCPRQIVPGLLKDVHCSLV